MREECNTSFYLLHTAKGWSYGSGAGKGKVTGRLEGSVTCDSLGRRRELGWYT